MNGGLKGTRRLVHEYINLLAMGIVRKKRDEGYADLSGPTLSGVQQHEQARNDLVAVSLDWVVTWKFSHECQPLYGIIDDVAVKIVVRL